MISNTEIRRFAKFLVVGCLNTGITYVCFVLLRLVGCTPEVSNTIGYIVGLINSFIWNKTWVFKTHDTNVVREACSFFLVFLICFLLQFVCFTTLIHHTGVNEYLAQLVSMVIYTVFNFILNRLFSFKQR